MGVAIPKQIQEPQKLHHHPQRRVLAEDKEDAQGKGQRSPPFGSTKEKSARLVGPNNKYEAQEEEKLEGTWHIGLVRPLARPRQSPYIAHRQQESIKEQDASHEQQSRSRGAQTDSRP